MLTKISRERSKNYDLIEDETIYEYLHPKKEELDKCVRFFIVLQSCRDTCFSEDSSDVSNLTDSTRTILMVFARKKHQVPVTLEDLQARLQKISELTAYGEAPDHESWCMPNTHLKLCFLDNREMNKQPKRQEILEFFDDVVFDAKIYCDEDDHIQDLEQYVVERVNFFFNVESRQIKLWPRYGLLLLIPVCTGIYLLWRRRVRN